MKNCQEVKWDWRKIRWSWIVWPWNSSVSEFQDSRVKNWKLSRIQTHTFQCWTWNTTTSFSFPTKSSEEYAQSEWPSKSSVTSRLDSFRVTISSLISRMDSVRVTIRQKVEEINSRRHKGTSTFESDNRRTESHNQQFNQKSCRTHNIALLILHRSSRHAFGPKLSWTNLLETLR